MWDFSFSVPFRFSQILNFCSGKCTNSLTLKRHNSFQNYINKKATQSFASRPLIFTLQQEVWKFNDICVSWSSQKTSLLNRRPCVPTWSTCQCACVPAWFTCQHAKSLSTSHFYVSSCQRAISHANVPNGGPIFQFCMPTCQTVCQRDKWRANFSTGHANVSNGVPTSQKVSQFLKHSSYEILMEISILPYYLKNFSSYLIS